jgi:signal transduction histidine kinase
MFVLFQIDLRAGERIITIDSKSEFFNPASESSYFIDKNKNLKFEQICREEFQDHFIPITKDIPNFGRVSSPVWIRFSVQNSLTESPFLEIDNTALDTIVYHLVNKDNILVHRSLAGNHQVAQSGKITGANAMIDMQIEDAQTYTCYLKINSNASAVMTPLRIASLENFYVSKQQSSVWQGIYFGLILFMLIYNIFLFISLKESTYIYFALFITSMGWLFNLLNGVGMNFIWINIPELNRFIPTVGSIAGIFMILFSSKFLNASEKTPKLHQRMTILIGLYVAIIFVNLLGFEYLAANLVSFNSLLALSFLMFLAVKLWKDDYEPAKLFLFSCIFLVAGIGTDLLQKNNLIDLNQFTANTLQISSFISILLMSFALSKKINLYIKNKNEAYQLAVKTALENEKLISSQNMLLEARVYQRTVDLEQSISTLSRQRKELHEANNFKDKVLSIISHDLKSPIATLAGMLGIMKMKSLTELERSNIVENLDTALKNTKILLDNILAWAHTNNDDSKETNEVEIYSCVNEIFDLFKFQASEKEIELRNNIEPNFHIHIHKNMFQLVLRNLISNALKFTPQQGTVMVNMKEEFENILISVKDSGIGMSKEIKENLFNSNKHTITRGTANEKGTGLGLKLCKEFVDKYNGELSVSSEPGKGTEVTVKLRGAIPVVQTVLL